MVNPIPKYDRKAIVKRIRQEGRDAFGAGKHRQTNPYQAEKTMNTYQWYQGYDAAKAEAEREDDDS